MTRSWSLLAALMVSGALLVPAVGHAAFPGRNGKVAFERKVGPGKITLWDVSPRTKRARQLTRVPRRCSRREAWRDTAPAYSPSGRQIVFIHYDDCGSGVRRQLRLVRANGSRNRRLRRLRAESPDTLSFSPSGNEILFGLGNSSFGSLRIVTVSARSGRIRRRVVPRVDRFGPWLPPPDFAWGPTNLLATSAQGAPGPIVVTSLELGPGRAVSEPWDYQPPGERAEVSDLDPDWSPSGEAIAFARSLCFGDDMRCDEYRSGIWVTPEAEGIADVQLTPSTDARAPAFSPDGEQIVFHHRSALKVVPASGGSVQTLIRRGRNPTWQPLR